VHPALKLTRRSRATAQDRANRLLRSGVKVRHDKGVRLVERMLKLHKGLPKAYTATDKTDSQGIVNCE